MSFDWNLYLPLAQELAARNDQAARRTAVSRAYYSAFHMASIVLRTNGIRTNPRHDGHPHQAVWNIFATSPNRDCKKIGTYGVRLRDARHWADYKADPEFSDALVQQYLAEAQHVIANADNPLPVGFTGASRQRDNRFVELFHCLKKLVR